MICITIFKFLSIPFLQDSAAKNAMGTAAPSSIRVLVALIWSRVTWKRRNHMRYCALWPKRIDCITFLAADKAAVTIGLINLIVLIKK
jgi:hypothetical protein